MAKSLIENLCIGSAFAAIAAACFSAPASAQTISPTCPAGYEVLIDNQCIDYETGYIVLAPVLSTAPRYTNANCRRGFEILIDNQCIDFQTGYIELATEAAPGATQAARK
jgi:hypothetical protein